MLDIIILISDFKTKSLNWTSVNKESATLGYSLNGKPGVLGYKLTEFTTTCSPSRRYPLHRESLMKRCYGTWNVTKLDRLGYANVRDLQWHTRSRFHFSVKTNMRSCYRQCCDEICGDVEANVYVVRTPCRTDADWTLFHTSENVCLCSDCPTSCFPLAYEQDGNNRPFPLQTPFSSSRFKRNANVEV